MLVAQVAPEGLPLSQTLRLNKKRADIIIMSALFCRLHNRLKGYVNHDQTNNTKNQCVRQGHDNHATVGQAN